jgi:hypothetical protein
MLMPLIWMKRGLPSENTVPATERVAFGGHGQLDVAVIDAGLVALDLGEHDAAFP